MAGNAAVASLIQETRRTEPVQPPTAPPTQADAAQTPPPGPAPRPDVPEPAARSDEQDFAPDDELAALDAAAEAPAAEAEAPAEGERELVALDAQAELA